MHYHYQYNYNYSSYKYIIIIILIQLLYSYNSNVATPTNLHDTTLNYTTTTTTTTTTATLIPTTTTLHPAAVHPISLCHPCIATTRNLSYKFPIIETSATVVCGSPGLNLRLGVPYFIASIWPAWANQQTWRTYQGIGPYYISVQICAKNWGEPPAVHHLSN